MQCVDNSSKEFLYYQKMRHHVNAAADGAASPCHPHSAGDAQSSVNFTAAFCRDKGLNVSTPAVGGGGEAGAMASYTLVEMYLYTVVIPLICLIGIVGNTINLVVLTSIVRNKPMDRMERSATVGLLALAVSDLFFCIAVIPLAFVDDVVISNLLTFALVYRVYHPAIISTFITSSTWLTVVMAVSRYLAICHPLKARIIIGMRFAAGSIAVAFLFSILLNIPRFLQSAIACADSDNSIHYFPVPGLLQRHGAVNQTYYALYLVVGIVLPLAVLAYSNFFLIRAIRNSRRMRRQFQRRGREDAEVDAGHRRGQHQHSQSDTTNAITLTLTVIVIMYAVLVSPAEISNIFTQMIDTYLEQQRTTTTKDVDESTVQSDDEDKQHASLHPGSYNIAVAIANTLQTMNFACNFILYCAVNVHFRRIVRGMITCQPWWRWAAARPTTMPAATTYVERNQIRNDHLTVSFAPKTSRLQLSSTSQGGDHCDVSDIDELDIQ